jgi:hypothetical protein
MDRILIDRSRGTMRHMASKQKTRSGRRGDPIGLASLTAEQAVDAIFQIKPADVKRILAKRPEKRNSRNDGSIL